MSLRLRRYLIDAYETRRSTQHPYKVDPKLPIQVDDQDDNDKLNEFCNIFCMVGVKSSFTIELTGTFPMSQSMVDLVEIYGGTVSREQGRLSLTLTPPQIEALMDLADRIRKTSFMGDSVNNPNWLSVSARTISSIYRFVRIIKDFNTSQQQSDILAE
ncbi:MAG: hypothetical protein JXA18_10060 [Chitinispirillaceae bacterium]|nr:hypothetical protein [Chitinispirillaceae bacterium]